jgi:hypothetical protein
MSYFAGELEPLSVRQAQFECDYFANLSFAQTVYVTAAFR